MHQRFEIVAPQRQRAVVARKGVLVARQPLQETAQIVEVSARARDELQRIVRAALRILAPTELLLRHAEQAKRIEALGICAHGLVIEARGLREIARLLKRVGAAQQTVIHASSTA